MQRWRRHLQGAPVLQKYRQLLVKLQAVKVFLQIAAIAACAKLQVDGPIGRRPTRGCKLGAMGGEAPLRPLGSTLTLSPVLQHQLRGEGKRVEGVEWGVLCLFGNVLRLLSLLHCSLLTIICDVYPKQRLKAEGRRHSDARNVLR